MTHIALLQLGAGFYIANRIIDELRHRGPQGPQGLNGVEGPQGSQGPQGPQGLNGARGLQGDQGLQGEEGDQGDQGQRGVEGPRIIHEHEFLRDPRTREPNKKKKSDKKSNKPSVLENEVSNMMVRI